jgi:hypothetical protein
VYSLEESQALLENLEVEKTENSKKYFLWFIFFTIAIYTGLRKGELLVWSGIMNVLRTNCYNSERGIYTDTPKTEQSVRTLKLPVEVIAKLKNFKS